MFGSVMSGCMSLNVREFEFLLQWADANSTIKSCTYQELGVIGNIRPDWFLDKRGSGTGECMDGRLSVSGISV